MIEIGPGAVADLEVERPSEAKSSDIISPKLVFYRCNHSSPWRSGKVVSREDLYVSGESMKRKVYGDRVQTRNFLIISTILGLAQLLIFVALITDATGVLGGTYRRLAVALLVWPLASISSLYYVFMFRVSRDRWGLLGYFRYAFTPWLFLLGGWWRIFISKSNTVSSADFSILLVMCLSVFIWGYYWALVGVKNK